jgi:hypothetical protein
MEIQYMYMYIYYKVRDVTFKDMTHSLTFDVHVVIAFKTINTLTEVDCYIIPKIKRRQKSTSVL